MCLARRVQGLRACFQHAVIFSNCQTPQGHTGVGGESERETATKKLWAVHSSFRIFFDEVDQVLLLHVLIVDGFEKSQRSEWDILEVNWEVTHFLMPVWMNDKSCFHMYIVDWYWFKSCLYLHEVAYNSQTRPWVPIRCDATADLAPNGFHEHIRQIGSAKTKRKKRPVC